MGRLVGESVVGYDGGRIGGSGWVDWWANRWWVMTVGESVVVGGSTGGRIGGGADLCLDLFLSLFFCFGGGFGGG